jgi:hypothetical protein
MRRASPRWMEFAMLCGKLTRQFWLTLTGSSYTRTHSKDTSEVGEGRF